ncbi:MAG: DEAD/DEAH box helicase [Dehalococcoidia bacterium]|nr:DEAD/DEAH box helicase [Dehalococcoidia bacterium]
MIFQNKTLACSDCGTDFTFSASEQKFFHSNGFHSEPRRCPACREKRSHNTRPAGNDTVISDDVGTRAPEIPAEAVGDFESFGLRPNVLAGVRLSGYTVPTPIQSKAMPHVLAGSDVIGLAQTGTGKTAAFVLPMLNRLEAHRHGNIRGLVISPTRELAEQTNESFASLGRRTGIRSVSLYGGVGMFQQMRNLRDGVDVAVACPGRLLDHVWQGSIDLSNVEMLVIDEADRMFDMGFLPDIQNILRCLPQKKQVLLFSATMPDDVRQLVQTYLHEPITVQIGHVAPASSVTQSFYPVRQHLKSALLLDLLRQVETSSVVVFTRTKHRAERVAEQLKNSGFKVVSLQGNLAQSRRQAAIDSFRRGKAKILVATDIASRGIDVLRISHVINFDMPDTTDAYTHRVGRTGRIDQTGEAYTFICPEDAEMVHAIERMLGKKVERRLLTGFNYDVEAPKTEKTRRPVSGNRIGGRAPAARTSNSRAAYNRAPRAPFSKPKTAQRNSTQLSS